MKILLTGEPGVGKSTVIQKFLNLYKGPVKGLFVERMKDETGYNQGFLIKTTENKERILAHRSLISSDIMIGNGHHVDASAIDEFIIPEVMEAVADPNSLLVFDEIGRMQALSPKFLETISQVLDSNVNILATIVSDPEPWSIKFKEHPQVKLIQVTLDNREELPERLVTAFESNKFS